MTHRIVGYASFIIPLIPPLLIIYYSQYPITQYLGITLLAIAIILGINGLLHGRIFTESLFSFTATLLVAILDEGYIPLLIHTQVFPINSVGMTSLNISTALTEYSLVLARLNDLLHRYEREFTAKGYDRDTTNKALTNLEKWASILTTTALLTSLAIYTVIKYTTTTIIDPFTALLIFTIAYLAIMRHLYNKINNPQ